MSQFIGHLHPALVHLPIGILLLGCLFQLLSTRHKFAFLKPAVPFIMVLGAITAIASAVTGYILSTVGDYDEELLFQHQWMGIGVAILSSLYYYIVRYRPLVRYGWSLTALLLLSIVITGHLGGSLTHGSDYLSFSDNSDEPDTPFVPKAIVNVQEAVAYQDIVQPILQEKCYGCHGPRKQKGRFRMDDSSSLMKGGKNGVVIKPGRAAESEMIKRILLEKTEEHHMPPKEKPQLNLSETALLQWWVADGASFNKQTKALSQPDKIKPILAALEHDRRPQKKQSDLPASPVEKASDADIQRLKNMGAVVLPVATGSNYLDISFVGNTSVSDKEMQLLLPLKKQVLNLRLSNTKISDQSMTLVAQCNNLQRLQLDGTGITDKGIAWLTQVSTLRSVNLVGTKITAKGLAVLSSLPLLNTVYVYKTDVKGADLTELAKKFSHTQIDTGGYHVPILVSDTTEVKAPEKKG